MVKPRLTPKQKKFVEGVAQGKPAYKAAQDAYDIESENKLGVANSIAVENMHKPAIRDALIPILAKHDISLDTAIAPIGKGLKASKWNDFTGEREDDVSTQLKASDRALKLLGVNQEATGNTFIQIIKEQKNEYGL